MQIYPKRRSFLTILASTGLLGAVGIQTPAEAAENTMATATSTDDSYSTARTGLIGVELINKATNERSFYGSINEVRNQSLPEGEYELLIVYREGDQIVTQSEQVTVDQQQQQLTDGETDELRAFVPSETVYEYYGPDDTVIVWVGAAGIEDGEIRTPTEGVDIEVQLQNPEDNQIDSTTATTGSDGNASVEFDLAALNTTPNGRYSVTVSAEGYSSTATSFDVGPYISTPFHWTGMTVDQQTTIGFYAALGGTPQSNVEYDISIDGPGDSSVTEPLSFSEGGIGLLEFTPTESGEYRFDAEASDEYGRSYESAELKALAPYFEVRDQYVNTTISWGAHIVSDKLPVADLELTITITDESDTVITEQTVTTNDFGQFTVEFAAPQTETEYEIELEAVDGRSVYLFGDGIDFEELPQETAESAIDIDVEFDAFQVAPNTDQLVSVQIQDDGTPVTNEAIDLVFSVGWDGLPAGSTELQTDSNGEASDTVSIPGDSIDGERFYATAFYDTGSGTVTGSDSVSVEKYDIEADDYLVRGETNTIPITATERATGNAASGIDITMFGNRENVDLETFDAGYTQTDANGEGSIELTVPEDVTNDIMVNDLTPYSSTSSSGGGFSDPITADVTVTPESPAVGDTITVSYTTDSEADVSALASFPEDEGADTIILQEGQEGEFVVPDYIDPGSYAGVNLLLLATDGEAAQDGTGIQIADGLNASFSYTPANPTAGEELTFDASDSSIPSGTIESFEWEFTGDGTTDRTGQHVSYTFTDPDSYDVTLTVTGDGGETDTTTGVVSVGTEESTPFFSVDIADPSDGEQVREDQDLTVIANVTNTGTVSGTQTISLTAPIEDSVDVADLSVEETERVEFTIPQDSIAGEFDITVQTEDTTDTVSVNGFDPCFIATAAYGTPAATEIDVLRDFRDDILRRNRLGVFMIQLYYRTSPPIADWVRQTDRRQRLIKDYLVSPLVESVRAIRSR